MCFFLEYLKTWKKIFWDWLTFTSTCFHFTFALWDSDFGDKWELIRSANINQQSDWDDMIVTVTSTICWDYLWRITFIFFWYTGRRLFFFKVLVRKILGINKIWKSQVTCFYLSKWSIVKNLICKTVSAKIPKWKIIRHFTVKSQSKSCSLFLATEALVIFNHFGWFLGDLSSKICDFQL